MADTELDAMTKVHGALDTLEPPARERVLQWAAAKFEVNLFSPGAGPGKATGSDGGDQKGSGEQFQELGGLVHAARPSSGPERALVVGYWFQELQGHDGWSGRDINSSLKNMGSGLANVTNTLDSLKARKPALVMQVGKSGRGPQARKTYKLTVAGVRAVRDMIANVEASESP